MSCPNVTSLEDAMKSTPVAILPASGLRRDAEGNLTEDALTMVVDGLKAKGILIQDPDTKKEILKSLASILCNIHKQYQYLIEELFRRVQAGEQIETKLVEAAKEKNNAMRDSIIVARHIDSLKPIDQSSSFIEGWQNTPRDTPSTEGFQALDGLNRDAEMLKSGSYLEMRKHMVEVTQEKNRAVSTYLGMYGFLNLMAVGLLIYVAASR